LLQPVVDRASAAVDVVLALALAHALAAVLALDVGWRGAVRGDDGGAPGQLRALEISNSRQAE